MSCGSRAGRAIPESNRTQRARRGAEERGEECVKEKNAAKTFTTEGHGEHRGGEGEMG